LRSFVNGSSASVETTQIVRRHCRTERGRILGA
jgi:hypothetical protein